MIVDAFPLSDCFYITFDEHGNVFSYKLEKGKKQVIRKMYVNVREDKAIADAHNIDTIPAFLLLHKRNELWRQVGELTVEELKDVLDDFK